MHVVVIHGWQEETAELARALAVALGITAYEARQRMIGGGPSVVASFADPLKAGALAGHLNQSGIATLVVDATAVRCRAGHFVVRRFELGESTILIESGDGQSDGIAYEEIDLILAATSIAVQTETKTVTERTFSLGKTVLFGGIPLTKKVERQEEVTAEERGKVLYLYAGDLPTIVFSQTGMTYEGLGAAMKPSRELNFAYLTAELRRLGSRAIHDDRLLTRAGQVRLLGPALNPETNLDLAAEILALHFRSGENRGR